MTSYKAMNLIFSKYNILNNLQQLRINLYIFVTLFN